MEIWKEEGTFTQQKSIPKESTQQPVTHEAFDFDDEVKGFIYENPKYKDVVFSDPVREAIDRESILWEHTLQKYEEYKKKNIVLRDVMFTVGNDQGLSFYENGVKLFISKSELVKKSTDQMFFSREYLKHSMNVAVKDIDHEKRIVYLSRNLAKQLVRPQIVEELIKSIDKRKYRKVKALVVWIEPHGRRAILDILGLNIPGILYAKDYSANYVKLNQVLSQGDRIEIMVIGKRENFSEPIQSNNRYRFICSRRSVVEEHLSRKWVDIEDRFPEKSNVSFRCVRIYDDHFLGEIDGFPDLRAYCYYPDGVSRYNHEDIVIKEGKKYVGFIKKVDEVKHILRIKTVDYLSIEDAYISQRKLREQKMDENDSADIGESKNHEIEVADDKKE